MNPSDDNQLAAIARTGNREVPEGAPVRHFHATIHGLMRLGPKKRKTVQFRMTELDTGGARKKDVKEYVLNRFSGTKKFIESSRKKRGTLYDMQVVEPCIIVLELDGDVNWNFTPGDPGVSSKSKANPEEDYGVYFYTDDFGVVGPDQAAPESCRVLYWHVASRPAQLARQFNLHIDLWEDIGGTIHRMPIIFDPNVPDTGGAAFP